ncbi:MAG: hypothetical protein V4702_02645 [Patescibacteria group bacterium]
MRRFLIQLKWLGITLALTCLSVWMVLAPAGFNSYRWGDVPDFIVIIFGLLGLAIGSICIVRQLRNFPKNREGRN